MVGLELEIGGNTIGVAVEQGVASVIVQTVKTDWENVIDLTFTGLVKANDGTDKYADWFKTELKEGDEMIIRVKEIAENSAPIQTRQRIAEPEHTKKMEQFLSLRKYLLDNGIPIPDID